MALKGDNVVVSNMKLERIFSMKGGKGETSYANNSQAQVCLFPAILTFFYLFFFHLHISFKKLLSACSSSLSLSLSLSPLDLKFTISIVV